MHISARKHCILFGVASTLVWLAAAVSASAIAVVDPGFELGTAAGLPDVGGWTYFNGAARTGVSVTNAHTGTRSGRLPASATVPGFFQTLQLGITDGAQFQLTAWGMTSNSISAGFALIQATFFSGTNGTGSNLGTVETSPGSAKTSNQITIGSPIRTWIFLDTGVFTAPVGSQSMQIFAVGPNITGGPVFIDDFSLVAIPEPSAFVLVIMGVLVGFPLLIRARRSSQIRGRA